MKQLTKEELHALDGILQQDKDLINKIISEALGLDDNDIQVRALRGYLAGLLLELEVDNKLREELAGYAASFDDGWTAAQEYAGKCWPWNQRR